MADLLRSDYQRNRAFRSLLGGPRVALTDREMEESSLIAEGILKDEFERLHTAGVWFAPPTLSLCEAANTITIFPFWAHCWINLQVKGVNNGHGAFAVDGNNRIFCGDPPAAGTRTDLVVLEVWADIVNKTETLHPYGVVDSDLIVANDLTDPRGEFVDRETCSRVQYRSELRVITNASMSSPPGTLLDKTGLAIQSLGNGLFGNDTSEHYVLPLWEVTREAAITALALEKFKWVGWLVAMNGRDALLGDFTPSQDTAPSAGDIAPTGRINAILGFIVNRLMAFAGATHWWDAPIATLKSLSDKFLGGSSSAGHKHTGGNGQGPKLDPEQALTYTPPKRAFLVGEETVVSESSATTWKKLKGFRLYRSAAHGQTGKKLHFLIEAKMSSSNYTGYLRGWVNGVASPAVSVTGVAPGVYFCEVDLSSLVADGWYAVELQGYRNGGTLTVTHWETNLDF